MKEEIEKQIKRVGNLEFSEKRAIAIAVGCVGLAILYAVDILVKELDK